MGKRKGSLLEKNVDKIFQMNGFETQRNIVLNGYEIDVFARLGLTKIICQCKQYERSYINVKDAIHLWAAKRKETYADKAIVVIYGQDVTPEERNLASKVGVMIWDETDLDKVDGLSKEQFWDYIELTKEKQKPNAPLAKDVLWTIVDIWLIIFGVLFLSSIGFLFIILFIIRMFIRAITKSIKRKQISK